MPKEKTGMAALLDGVLAKEKQDTGFKAKDTSPKRAGLSILEREAREVSGDDSESDDTSDDSSDDSSDGDIGMKELFRRKMNGDSPFKKEEEKEDDNEEEEEAREEKPKKKEDDTKEDDSDDKEKQTPEFSEELQKKVDDALGVDLNQLTTKNGGPVNPQVTQVMKRFKATIRDLINDNKRIRGEKSLPADPELANNFKNLKEAHDALKKQWEERYFEESPEFKDTYDKPVEVAAAEASKWLSAHDFKDGSEEKSDIDAMKTLMHESLYAGDEIKFYKASDSIAEMLPKGIANRFVAASVKLWDAHAAKSDAFKNKDEARKSVINKTSSFVESASTEAVTGLDALHTNFESMNKKILDVYKNDPKYKGIIDYDKTVAEPLNSVKKHIDHAIRSRKISPELQQIIYNGVIFGLKEKEMDGLRALVKNQREAIEVLEKKIGDKDKSLSRVRTKTSQSLSSGKKEDDDDDTPSSLKELWNKRMKNA